MSATACAWALTTIQAIEASSVIGKKFSGKRGR
jgi:hypothetical protein